MDGGREGGSMKRVTNSFANVQIKDNDGRHSKLSR